MNPSEPDEAAHKIPASEAGLMLSIEAADPLAQNFYEKTLDIP